MPHCLRLKLRFNKWSTGVVLACWDSTRAPWMARSEACTLAAANVSLACIWLLGCFKQQCLHGPQHAKADWMAVCSLHAHSSAQSVSQSVSQSGECTPHDANCQCAHTDARVARTLLISKRRLVAEQGLMPPASHKKHRNWCNWWYVDKMRTCKSNGHRL